MDAYIDSIARGETEIDEQSQQKPGICEYLRERDGETRHVFQLFCECNEVDQTLEDLVLRGKVPTADRLHRIERDISDRIRIPWPGGAIPLNIWFFLIPLLLFIEYAVAFVTNCPRSVSVTLNSLVVWWSIRSMRSIESARSHMHLQFTGWAVVQIVSYYYYVAVVLSPQQQWQYYFLFLPSSLSAFEFLALLSLIALMISFICLRCCNPGTLPSMRPPTHNNKSALAQHYVAHAHERAKYCRISNVGVSHYDHFCIWVGMPIGRDNRRWFLLFCYGMSMCGGMFWYWAEQQSSGGSSSSSSSSSSSDGGGTYLAVVATRSLMGSVATLCLLLRQSWLITNNFTTYEALYRKELRNAGWMKGNGGGCWRRWKLVLMPAVRREKGAQ